MLGWSINLFRVRGIQLSLHFSFVLWLAFFAWSGYQESGVPGMFWSSVTLLAFFTCVVLHELGHSLTARRFGIGVRRILLMPIGGMAEFDSIPREPRREFLITIAGPAVNFAIAGVLWALQGPPLAWGLGSNPSSLVELLDTLLVWNVWMGLFNLIPVFPMDGGRILRSILAMKLPYLRATYISVRVGRVLAILGIIRGVWTENYVLAALFAFILFVGDAEYRMLLRREREEAQWRTAFAPYPTVPSTPSPPEEPPLLRP